MHACPSYRSYRQDHTKQTEKRTDKYGYRPSTQQKTHQPKKQQTHRIKPGKTRTVQFVGHQVYIYIYTEREREGER